jgi:tetratricopeptide (TPR) repeat protein
VTRLSAKFRTAISAKFWTTSLVLLVLAAADGVGLFCRVALAQQANDSSNQSWASSISSSVKSGFSKIGHALDPKKTPPEDDAVSLNGKSKPGPELFVALARLYEEANKLGDAEQQYQAARKLNPDHLPALLGYARLKERLGQIDDATWLYQRAVKAYPNEASVQNNIGLFYARQGRLDEAAAAMAIAVQLAPKNPLYRNNIATVLVDQGKFREAFGHLKEVHSEAAAYYNLGYLLNKKGQTPAAIQHFALALRADPSMTAARQWCDYLQKRTTQARLPQHPTANGLRIATEPGERDAPRAPRFSDSPRYGDGRASTASAPMPDQEALSIPPDAPMPRRLPPLPPREPESANPTLPGMSYDPSERPAISSAPLPPPTTNSAVRRLPSVN